MTSKALHLSRMKIIKSRLQTIADEVAFIADEIGSEANIIKLHEIDIQDMAEDIGSWIDIMEKRQNLP